MNFVTELVSEFIAADSSEHVFIRRKSSFDL